MRSFFMPSGTPIPTQHSAYSYVRQNERGEKMDGKNMTLTVGYVAVGMFLDDTIDFLITSDYVLASISGLLAVVLAFSTHRTHKFVIKQTFLDGYIEGTTKTVTQVMKTLKELVDGEKK